MAAPLTPCSPCWRSRAGIVVWEGWGPRLLPSFCSVSSIHASTLWSKILPACLPSRVKREKWPCRTSSSPIGAQPRNCVTSAPHLIGQNWVTWPLQQQRRLGNVVFILIGHVFREGEGEISHAGQLAPSVREDYGEGDEVPEPSAISKGDITGSSDWMNEGVRGRETPQITMTLPGALEHALPLQLLIAPLLPWKMWALWCCFSSPSSLGLLTTPKCTASCCLLRKWKLILMLALAQTNLEANQLLPLNKGLESQIEMTSNLQAVCSHLRHSTTLLWR